MPILPLSYIKNPMHHAITRPGFGRCRADFADHRF